MRGGVLGDWRWINHTTPQHHTSAHHTGTYPTSAHPDYNTAHLDYNTNTALILAPTILAHILPLLALILTEWMRILTTLPVILTNHSKTSSADTQWHQYSLLNSISASSLLQNSPLQPTMGCILTPCYTPAIAFNSCLGMIFGMITMGYSTPMTPKRGAYEARACA